MPALSYVHIIDLDKQQRFIHRFPTISSAKRFARSFPHTRNAFIYVLRYDRIIEYYSYGLACKSY